MVSGIWRLMAESVHASDRLKKIMNESSMDPTRLPCGTARTIAIQGWDAQTWRRHRRGHCKWVRGGTR